MMLSCNAFFFRKAGGRHRAGKRIQAKRALFAARQDSVLDRANLAARVTDNAFPPLSPGTLPLLAGVLRIGLTVIN